MTFLTRCVAIAVAVSLAAPAAWGHTFPPVRTIVVQVEPCEVVLLVGYRPGTGEPTEAILARVASQPKSLMLDALRGVMSAYAMAPIVVAVDGKSLVPAAVRAKIGLEAGGARPMVVILVTYAMPHAGQLSISSKDPHSTSISWQDRGSDRVDLPSAPTQGKWFAGVASFLLSLTPLASVRWPSGDSACVPSQPRLDSSP